MQPKTLTIGAVLVLVALTCLVYLSQVAQREQERREAQEATLQMSRSLLQQMRQMPDQFP